MIEQSGARRFGASAWFLVRAATVAGQALVVHAGMDGGAYR